MLDSGLGVEGVGRSCRQGRLWKLSSLENPKPAAVQRGGVVGGWMHTGVECTLGEGWRVVGSSALEVHVSGKSTLLDGAVDWCVITVDTTEGRSDQARPGQDLRAWAWPDQAS